ncbi:hypothetical protein BH23ACT10_BH23ACT10_38680 [soil metagenome]
MNHDQLRLFHGPTLRGPWVEHPDSPLVDRGPLDRTTCWRPLVIDGRTYRLAQDCTTNYGVGVVAHEITHLTPTDYAECDTPLRLLAAGGTGWRRNGMHHLSAQPLPSGDWLIATDGW